MKKVKVELTFPSALKDEPIFYHMCRNFDVIFNIIEASFSTENGWAYVTLEGEEEAERELGEKMGEGMVKLHLVIQIMNLIITLMFLVKRVYSPLLEKAGTFFK